MTANKKPSNASKESRSPLSAVGEHRTFTVTCVRQIVDECSGDVTNSKVRNRTQAAQTFRDDGWTLHTDGTATCPACMAAWTGQLPMGRTDG